MALQTSQKLTLEQREEAFSLLETGMLLRQVAKHFEVNPESLRRLVSGTSRNKKKKPTMSVGVSHWGSSDGTDGHPIICKQTSVTGRQNRPVSPVMQLYPY